MTFALVSPATISTCPIPCNWISASPPLRERYGATLQGAYPIRVDYGSQAAPTDVVVERLGRRPFRLIAELRPHSRGVHDAAVAQIIKLITSDLGIAVSPSQRIQRPHAKPGYGH